MYKVILILDKFFLKHEVVKVTTPPPPPPPRRPRHPQGKTTLKQKARKLIL